MSRAEYLDSEANESVDLEKFEDWRLALKRHYVKRAEKKVARR